jgi:hypothetical protein
MLSMMGQVGETPMGGKAIRSIIVEASGNSVARRLWLGMTLHAGRGKDRFMQEEQPHICVNDR